ncbi:MAG: hypothetical protein IPK19_13350 [Chloroflexi bacterium]|nr:hypothetical protein [Chloroflexota bacterium]
MAPEYVRREDVPASVVEAERTIQPPAASRKRTKAEEARRRGRGRSSTAVWTSSSRSWS